MQFKFKGRQKKVKRMNECTKMCDVCVEQFKFVNIVQV